MNTFKFIVNFKKRITNFLVIVNFCLNIISNEQYPFLSSKIFGFFNIALLNELICVEISIEIFAGQLTRIESKL